VLDALEQLPANVKAAISWTVNKPIGLLPEAIMNRFAILFLSGFLRHKHALNSWVDPFEGPPVRPIRHMRQAIP